MEDHSYSKRGFKDKESDVSVYKKIIDQKDAIIRDLRAKLRKYEQIFEFPSTMSSHNSRVRSLITLKANQIFNLMSTEMHLPLDVIQMVIRKMILLYFPQVIQISTSEFIELENCLGISARQAAKLRKFVNLKKKWIYVSCDMFVRKEKSEQLAKLGVSTENWEWGGEKRTNRKEDIFTFVCYLYVKNFKEFLFSTLENYFQTDAIEFLPGWGEKVILIAMYGDYTNDPVGPSPHGSYKEAFFIVNSILNAPITPSRTHIYSMFEYVEHPIRLTKYLNPLHAQIAALENTPFEYNNEFYNLKFVFICDLEGLSSRIRRIGSTSSFMSPINLIELDPSHNLPLGSASPLTDVSDTFAFQSNKKLKMSKTEKKVYLVDNAVADPDAPSCKIILPGPINAVLSAVRKHGDTLHAVMSKYLLRYGKLLSRSMRLKKALEDFALSSSMPDNNTKEPKNSKESLLIDYSENTSAEDPLNLNE